MKEAILHMRVWMPDNVSFKEAREYCTDALGSWGGSLQPPGVDEGGVNPDAKGDPLFHGIKVKSFAITHNPKKRGKGEKRKAWRRDDEDGKAGIRD